MKKFVVILLLLALCVSMVSCGKSVAEPTEPTTEPATTPTERKPIVPMDGNTPTLSSGTGCAGDLSSPIE